MERVYPKILEGAIEDVYQTPFRLPENFGEKYIVFILFNCIYRK